MLMETPIGAFDLDLSDFELGTKGVSGISCVKRLAS